MPEYVQVPVPVDRLQEVYEVLGRAPRAAGPAQAATTNGWTDALLTRAYNESPAAMKGVLDFLAAHPEEVIRSDQVARAIDHTNPGLAGVLGAFGRRHRNRYSMESPPFEARWSHEDNMVVYRMPNHIARVVAAARN